METIQYIAIDEGPGADTCSAGIPEALFRRRRPLRIQTRVTPLIAQTTAITDGVQSVDRAGRLRLPRVVWQRGIPLEVTDAENF
jgi:hypothetical protein